MRVTSVNSFPNYFYTSPRKNQRVVTEPITTEAPATTAVSFGSASDKLLKSVAGAAIGTAVVLVTGGVGLPLVIAGGLGATGGIVAGAIKEAKETAGDDMGYDDGRWDNYCP